jgi:ABC-type transporter Mla MlaB component
MAKTLLFMLRISQAGKTNHSVTLKLEGRVAGPWVGELRQVCETLLTEGRTLKLDLAEVTFADTSGVAVLSNFRSRGVGFRNCSPFVQEQMKNPIRD